MDPIITWHHIVILDFNFTNWTNSTNETKWIHSIKNPIIISSPLHIAYYLRYESNDYSRFIRIQRRFTESTHPSDNESSEHCSETFGACAWRTTITSSNPSNSEISLRIARRQSFVIIRYANRLSRKRSESRVGTEAYLLERDSCGEKRNGKGEIQFF